MMMLDIDPADFVGTVEVTLIFDDGTEVTVDAAVRSLDGMDMDMDDMDDDMDEDMDDDMDRDHRRLIRPCVPAGSGPRRGGSGSGGRLGSVRRSLPTRFWRRSRRPFGSGSRRRFPSRPRRRCRAGRTSPPANTR